MSVTQILNPFWGERVIGVSPTPAARVTDWNRRLNLFSGRALSASALTAEQEGQAGRLALRGQMVSPGVVQGLETGLEAQDKTNVLNIGSGFGVCASGEDVFVPKLSRTPLDALPVYTTSALLDGAPPLGTGELAARRLGPTLGELIAKGVAVPSAGVIVLQPVSVDQLANFDPASPCQEDSSSTAFDDEQLLDGVRVVYYAWPDEWLLLPAPGDRWRNRLAYAIFEREALNAPGQIMPWESVGLPVGLLGFDDKFQPLFIDRHAVVRQGGQPRPHMLTPDSGHEFLWQARIQQFAEHAAALGASGLTAADMAKEFRYLPPTGLLPRGALDFLTGDAAVTTRISATQFFPGTYSIDAVPAPLEQLDLVARQCGSLAAFDTFAADQVSVIVPVPQIWYEPDLLKVLQIDPIFQQTVDNFVHQRAVWLKRRQDVRTDYAALVTAASGVAPTFPDPDPDAAEPNEEIASAEVDPGIDAFKDPELGYGISVSNGVSAVDDVENLRKTLVTMPGVADETPQLNTLGLAKFADMLQAKADAANDKIDLGFLRVQTDIYRTRQKMLSSEAATRLAVSPALASIAQGASALATKTDIEAFLQNAKTALTPSTAPAAATAPPGNVTSSHVVLAAGSFTPAALTFIQATPAITQTQAVRASTFTGATQLFAARQLSINVRKAASVNDVAQQTPITGASYNLRTTSVVERLQDPPTAEVKNYTVASKYSAIANFMNAGIFVGDISIPGILDANGNETTKTFAQVDAVLLNEILAGKHDPLALHADQSSIFAAGVRAMENTIDILRRMEARVALYRQAADLCRATLALINDNSSSAWARLQAIANNLAEARHDVSVAKALMAEELQRIGGINARRDQIISTQVRFLVYYRPRSVSARSDLPVRSLDPGLTAAVIPTCLARNLAAPDELRAYVNLLREAPLNWFQYVPPLLTRFDRLEVLQSVVQNARLRAGFNLSQASVMMLRTSPGPLGPEILRIHSAQQQVIASHRLALAQTDLNLFSGATWSASRDRAVALLSLGDLVDLGHYHPEVPRVSAAELENILKVASCLYSNFSAVLPVIRLNWAERLLQIGATLNLRNLGALPRWGEVPPLDRKEMQAMVDWLFSRLATNQADAIAHMNDLVRVCILLASHAPVADIIAGDVIHNTRVIPGVRINLTADLSRVRLGMHVLMYQANQPVARGVVEDLGSGIATARILTANAGGVLLGSGSKVHYAAADAFDRNPYTSALV